MTSVTDIALLSEEAVGSYYGTGSGGAADTGAVRMLLEGKFLFDIIDADSLFEGIADKYKLLILPDNIRLDDKLTSAIKSFTEKGGRVLATGESGLGADNTFKLDLGCEFVGESAFRPVYFRPRFDVKPLGSSAFVIYEKAYDISARLENTIIERENPYFNRTTFYFSSHQHTPNNKSERYPAAAVGSDGAYISAKIFSEYSTKGSLIAKLLTNHIINMLLEGKKTLETTLPAQGVVTLMNQIANDRLICHLLYSSPVKRGNGIEIIEDEIPLYNIKTTIHTGRDPKKLYTAPDMHELEYTYDSECVTFVLDKLATHSAAVIEF